MKMVLKHQKRNNKQIGQTASVLEPIPSEYRFTTQKSISEWDLILFRFSCYFCTTKLFVQSFKASKKAPSKIQVNQKTTKKPCQKRVTKIPTKQYY